MAYRKSDYESLEKQPCACVSCGECNGTGNVWRNYDHLGRYIIDGGVDDLSELEPCESCRNGITEVCDRCRLLEEMYEQDQEDEYRQSRSGFP